MCIILHPAFQILYLSKPSELRNEYGIHANYMGYKMFNTTNNFYRNVLDMYDLISTSFLIPNSNLMTL